jgi:hypothetical protein
MRGIYKNFQLAVVQLNYYICYYACYADQRKIQSDIWSAKFLPHNTMLFVYVVNKIVAVTNIYNKIINVYFCYFSSLEKTRIILFWYWRDEFRRF